MTSFFAHKSRKLGFTLVEVIVVAVIVAILAASAIPIYRQYVIDASNHSAQNAGGSIASFCGACLSSKGTLDINGDPITCSNGSQIRKTTDVTISIDQTTQSVTARGSRGDQDYTFRY